MGNVCRIPGYRGQDLSNLFVQIVSINMNTLDITTITEPERIRPRVYFEEHTDSYMCHRHDTVYYWYLINRRPYMLKRAITAFYGIPYSDKYGIIIRVPVLEKEEYLYGAIPSSKKLGKPHHRVYYYYAISAEPTKESLAKCIVNWGDHMRKRRQQYMQSFY